MQVTLPPDHQARSVEPPGKGNPLPPGTVMGEFEIRETLGIGGFGIVYLADDQYLGRPVALKEYMPESLAIRCADGSVAVKADRHRNTFEIGLRSFVNEAHLLAQFDHPALVKVHRFWEANGTAYMVMPRYRGVTLRQAVSQREAPADEEWLLGLLGPLTEALETIHRQECLHRDIAPDNILILENGRPLLLDFGAARQVIGDTTQDLTVILKPGYAPIEQYDNGVAIKQGPWTDVYALAAVVYYCATGKTPVPSVSRTLRDTLVPFSAATEGRYSARFCQAIETALCVPVEGRTPSMLAFRDTLGLDAGDARDPGSLATAQFARDAGGDARHGRLEATQAWTPDADRQFAQLERRRATSSTPRHRSRIPALAAATFVSLALLGGGVWWLAGSDPEPPVVAQPASAPATRSLPLPASLPPTTKTAPASAESAAPAAENTDAPSGTRATSSAVPATSLAVPSDSEEIPARFSIEEALAQLHAARDSTWDVAVLTDRSTVRIERDKIQFRVRSGRAGYLYLLMQGTDYAHFYQLFPNGIDDKNRIEANKEIALPRPSWTMVASGPPGTNRFVALVTPSPRTFEAAGLLAPTRKRPIAEFDLAAARVAFERDGAVAFAGTPVGCRLDPGECATYGAARFEIDETR